MDDLHNTGNSSVFYGVNVLPGSSSGSEPESPLVFTDKTDALNTARKNKGSRFKAFTTRDEAVSFSMQRASTPKLDNSNSHGCVSNIADSSPNSPINLEKPCPFRAPRSQDMVKLRKAIETGDLECFTNTVWSNPRYLISSGDTPSIMQEGFRYNGLHVAAKSKQPKMCLAILSTVEDETFLQLLFPDDVPEIIQQRKRFIMDLYLNMPDKGMCETPLHFASKFGCAKSVEVLLSHYTCDRSRQNKYGKTPREVICERLGNKEIQKTIEQLYEARYFVPVLRSEGNSVQPIIGRPFSLEDSVISQSHQPSTPKNPLLNMRAKAGPMPYSQAAEFYRIFKAPTTPLSMTAQEIRLSDSAKGLERIGRNIAEQMNVPWTEYWSFMNCWCNLVTSEGLARLEVHLTQIYSNVVNQMKALDTSHLHQTLNSLEDSLTSPISQLCRQFEAIHLDSPYSEQGSSNFTNSSSIWSSPSNARNKRLQQVSKVLLFDSPPTQVKSLNRSDRRSLDFSSGPEEDKQRDLNFHIYEISEKLCFKLVELFSLETVTMIDAQDLLRNTLPIYEKFLKYAEHTPKLNLHRDIAKQTLQKLSDDFCTRGDILKVSELSQILIEEDMDQSFSDPEETDSPFREYTRRGIKIPDLAKLCKISHLKCVLRQLNQSLNPTNSITKPCSCSWNVLTGCSSRSNLNDTVQNYANKSTSDEEISEDEFITPPSSNKGSRSCSPTEMHTPDEGLEVFIEGLKPSKVDLDVLNALQGVKIDPLLYPHLHLWRHFIDSVPKEEIKNWSSPAGVSRRMTAAKISKKDNFLHFSSGKQKSAMVSTNKVLSRFSRKSPTEIKYICDSFTT